MKRILLLIAVVFSLIAMRPVPSLAQACGTERWSVKTGTDSDAVCDLITYTSLPARTSPSPQSGLGYSSDSAPVY